MRRAANRIGSTHRRTKRVDNGLLRAQHRHGRPNNANVDSANPNRIRLHPAHASLRVRSGRPRCSRARLQRQRQGQYNRR